MCIANPKKHTKQKLVTEFRKVSGYKDNIQKSIIFLYTSSELSENEIKETISIIIASKRMKSLGTNFNKRYS